MTTHKERELTGYPSIDKPWMKFYKSKALDYDFPHMNIYDYMRNMTEGNQQKTAITYYGKKICYSQFYENIEIAAKFLIKLGVKEQSRIMFLMPNIPETAYLFYATAKIGAVSDFIDPRPDSVDFSVSAEKVFGLIEQERADFIISLDQCYLAMIKPVEKKIKAYGIKEVVIVSASTSMQLREKSNYLKDKLYLGGILEVMKAIKKQKVIQKAYKEAVSDSALSIIEYGKEIAACKDVMIPPVAYKQEWIAAIVHSSGTSGTKPKPIVLTHENMNAYIHNTIPARMPTAVGDSALHILPYFAAYGLVNVVHSGFCHVNNLIQIPEFCPSDIGKMILKYEPQTIIGTPAWFVQLTRDKCLKGKNLSFMSMVTYGGDSMDISDEKEVNHFLKEHKCHVNLTKGHGMSECCGCSTFANNEYNKLGTVGIPLPYTIYAVLDPENKKMIKFDNDKEYIEGELAISSKCVTPGVLDGEVIVPHYNYNGQDYILTRDIARMDREGIITFLGRSDRSFTRYDGYKYKPYEIEDLFKRNTYIKKCIICPYNDEKKFGVMPIANIVVADGKCVVRADKIAFVKDIIYNFFIRNPEVSTRQIPSKIRFMNSVPLTFNGKVDYKALEKMSIDGTEINIDFEEDSMSVGDIRIY